MGSLPGGRGDSRIFEMEPTYDLIDHLMVDLKTVNALAW